MRSLPKGQRLTDESAWQRLLDLAVESPERATETTGNLTDSAETDFIDLYSPICQPLDGRSRVVGHLGQSIDGYIATANGDADFVNDEENIRHLHRLRALHQAVIVGAGTIASDNPRLTTRLVPGRNPLRIVLDPQRRLPTTSTVFTDDAAETLLIVAEESSGAKTHGQAEVLFAPATDGRFDLAWIVAALAERGIEKLFVEGGGTTVSRFFEAALLDRLQIALAPVFIGDGKPGLKLPKQEAIDACPHLRHRVFAMGSDLLFDCDLSSKEAPVGISVVDRSNDGPLETGLYAKSGEPSSAIRRIR